MKKFILSSVVLLLFILISGCDKNDKNVEFSVYEFYFELVDENGNPFIDNMDDMETLADKMELKWVSILFSATTILSAVFQPIK